MAPLKTNIINNTLVCIILKLQTHRNLQICLLTFESHEICLIYAILFSKNTWKYKAVGIARDLNGLLVELHLILQSFL